MKARSCLACAAALALAVTVAGLPAGAQPQPEPQPEPKPASEPLPIAPSPRDGIAPYDHTAIGAVIAANGWKIPANGVELTNALAKLGDFVQLPVTFSAVALHSGLSHPRVVITMRPSTTPPPVDKFFPDGRLIPNSGGWGGGGFTQGGTTKKVAGTPMSLGRTDANKPYLEGRLFLAANTEIGATGQPFVKTVEFISWNSRKLKFDFGVIEGMGGTPELKVLDGARCFSCHKNRGPILGAAPWSNTAHNDLIRNTAKPLFKFPHALGADGKEDAKLAVRTDIDGMQMLLPHAVEVDAAVRLGADALRDRELVKLLARSADGRKALVILMTAAATRKPIEDDKHVRFELNLLDLVTFMHDAHALNKATAPNVLADFSPAGPVSKAVVTRTEWGGTTNQVNRYDANRAHGEHGLPSVHQPSNPKAFTRPVLKAPQRPADVISALTVARAIGLNEDDRDVIAVQLDRATSGLGAPTLTPAALAKLILSGPRFADVLQTGVLPDRDDFKDRFIAGLTDFQQSRDKNYQFPIPRDKYASIPLRSPNAAPEKEVEVLPSHACLRCHDVRNGAKPAAFNPIPMLAFDPFDATAREAWLKTAERKKKIEVLSRLVKRLGTDKDMPPEDSTESEMYRVKDPAALNAVKDWLDSELKKAKSN